MGDKSTKVKSRTPHRKDDVSNYSEKVEENEKIQNLKYSTVDRRKKDLSIEEFSHKEDSESNHNNSYYDERSMDTDKKKEKKGSM